MLSFASPLASQIGFSIASLNKDNYKSIELELSQVMFWPEVGEASPPKKVKREAMGVETILKQTAEIEMVLVGLAALRGGAPPSPVECHLAVKAYTNLEGLVERVAPHDLVSKKFLQSLIQQFTLSQKPILPPVLTPTPAQVVSTSSVEALATPASAKAASTPGKRSRVAVKTATPKAAAKPGVSETPITRLKDARSVPITGVKVGKEPKSSPRVRGAKIAQSLIDQRQVPQQIASNPLIDQRQAHQQIASNPLIDQRQAHQQIASNPLIDQRQVHQQIASNPLIDPRQVHQQIASNPLIDPRQVHQQIASNPLIDQRQVHQQIASNPLIDQRQVHQQIASNPLIDQRQVHQQIASNPLIDQRQVHQQIALAIQLSKPDVFMAALSETAGAYINSPIRCDTCKVLLNDTSSVLICDGCEAGFHLLCLQMHKHSDIPEKGWYCTKCVAVSGGQPRQPIYGPVRRGPGRCGSRTTSIKSACEHPSTKASEYKLKLRNTSAAQDGEDGAAKASSAVHASKDTHLESSSKTLET